MAIPAIAPVERDTLDFFLPLATLVMRAGAAVDDVSVGASVATAVTVSVTGKCEVMVHVDVALTVVFAFRTLQKY